MLMSKATTIPQTCEVRLLAGMNGSKIAASAMLLIVGILSIVAPVLSLWLWPFWLGGY
jgi:hypothetical protein